MFAKKKKLCVTEAAILGILTNGERYGRDILGEYQERTKRRMPLGSLYVTLDRMEQAGFLRSRWGESTHERGGNHRKYYKITGVGERALNELNLWIWGAQGA